MTVSSWSDVPPGMPVHHHCLVTLEWSHDCKHWTDPTTVKPHLVAWHPRQVFDWEHSQMKAHLPEAQDAHDRRKWLEDDIESFTPFDETPFPCRDHLPSKWELMANALATGRWSMSCYALSPGRFLVFQILSYADKGQESQFRGKSYQVCNIHDRPEDQPYPGLLFSHREHFRRLGALYS